MVNEQSIKLQIPNMGFCTLFRNVETIISRLSMENIISIKKPILFKNGISFRNLHHNSKYVFYMVHEQSTKLKIPNMGFCTLFRNVGSTKLKISNMGFKYTSCKHANYSVIFQTKKHEKHHFHRAPLLPKSNLY